MGYLHATELANNESLSLEEQIRIHFTSNCYPPIPLFMVDVAVQAINAYNDLEGSKLIELPAGVSFRNSKEVSAFDVVDSLRLEAWTNTETENE